MPAFDLGESIPPDTAHVSHDVFLRVPAELPARIDMLRPKGCQCLAPDMEVQRRL